VCHTLHSLAICFAPSLVDLIIFLTLTRLVPVINIVNFIFALFTPPLGDFQELTSGSKSVDHRPQNLGHHGERERWEREGGYCAGELNEGKRPGEGAHGEGMGARGARAELGRAAPRVKTPWHAQPHIGIQFAKQNTK
jgi:hypothetical protein